MSGVFAFSRYELKSKQVAVFVGGSPSDLAIEQLRLRIKVLAGEFMPLLSEEEKEEWIEKKPWQNVVFYRACLPVQGEGGREVLFQELLEQKEVDEPPHLATVEKVDLYFRLEWFFQESFFQSLPQEGKKRIWQEVEAIEIFEEEKLSPRQEGIVEAIRLLSFYPALRPLFASFSREIFPSQEVRQFLFFRVVVPFCFPDIARVEHLSLAKSILLYGAPRCGQETLVNVLSRYLELEDRVITLSVQDMSSLEEKIGEVKRSGPCILFIKEFSAFFPREEQIGSRGVKEGVTEQFFQAFSLFIEQMQSLGVLVIASTNYPEKIDPGIFQSGRLQHLVYVPPPDAKGRLEFLRTKVPLLFEDVGQIDLNTLALRTEYYTPAEIMDMLHKAVERKKRCQSFVDSPKLAQMCLDQALEDSKPVLNRSVCESFEVFRRRYANLHRIVQSSDFAEEGGYIPSLVNMVRGFVASFF